MAKGSELATAYLTLIPSLKGAEKSIERQLKDLGWEKLGEGGGEKMGDSAAKKAGDKLKSGMKTAAKAAGAVAAAAFAGAFAIGKQSLDAYADYEQLTGGIETLFKDSSGTMQQYAANAYKTAGMSANDYMETVTSFSASLISSLGGDTAKAAEAADMAITDMSDNANKMGTSMDLIQNAYQGFAKQNYTMLDNLKLGYGGTKEEMQRLLDDATALSGIEYDISSYADVVAAIHVIQTQWGITGTTAAEAASTISGSLASVSAAWTNWLAGIANENADIGALTDQLVDTAITAASNVIPRLGVIMTTVATSVKDEVMKLLTSLIEQLHTNGPAMAEAALEMLLNMVTAVGEVTTLIVDALVLMLASLIVAIVNKGVEFYDSAVVVMGEMAQGIASGASFVLSEIERGITDGVNKVKGMASDFVEAGKDLVRGIADGISGAVDWVLDAINRLCTNALDTVKDFFGIASPSKLMRKMFGYVGEGAALGILDSAGSVVGAMESMAADAFSVVSNAAKPTLSMSASLGSASLGGSYEAARSTTNNQTINIYQPVKSAAETARVMRMQRTYGLAGAR